MQIKRQKLQILKSKVRKLDVACSIIGMLGVVIGIIEHELFFNGVAGKQY